ncbi:hypothetical protein MLD38_011392 [Melastoma candidum]|uniref:Uncharacterized protein n=1 Tax=Melastoma candidum TaxID=119954 RepID=A0ACB9R491_9MYRT|nr:hypothetical protein MLD38_011392 [Melastoma candidum]
MHNDPVTPVNFWVVESDSIDHHCIVEYPDSDLEPLEVSWGCETWKFGSKKSLIPYTINASSEYNGDRSILTPFKVKSASLGKEETTKEPFQRVVGISVPKGRDLRKPDESDEGQKWSRRRDSVGWPECEKAASLGEKIVRDEDSGKAEVSETSSRVKAIEVKRALASTSAAFRSTAAGKVAEKQGQGRHEMTTKARLRVDDSINVELFSSLGFDPRRRRRRMKKKKRVDRRVEPKFVKEQLLIFKDEFAPDF